MPRRVSVKGRGADLFFGEESAPPEPEDGALTPPAVAPEAQQPDIDRVSSANARESLVTPELDAKPQPKRQSRSRTKSPAATSSANETSLDDVDVIEEIRQIVKMPGREVSYVRLTPEEKARLSDVIYTYKRQGQKTTETEINRIALNYLLNDYYEHGEQSVLARVLAALAA